MTHDGDHDPLDRYMDAFGERLAAAQATATAAPHRRDRLPRLALIAGPVAALGLTALLLLLPGGTTPRRLDVVAEARAALTPKAGQLTHLVVTQSVAGQTKAEQPPFTTTEQWSATRPVRWRLTYVNPKGAAPHPGERVEIDYADGVEQEYFPTRNHLRRVHGIRPHAAPAAHPLGTDPIATLRAMLARGTLRDTGTGAVGDRAVRILAGRRTLHLPNGKTLSTAVEYAVDPGTFTPVRARIQVPPFGDAAPFFVVLDFKAFERLPLTGETEKLLAIHPKPNPTITEIGRKR